MHEINFSISDIFAEIKHGDGVRFLAHVCDNAGTWGAGFSRAISDHWIQPEMAYRTLFSKRIASKLGDVQYTLVDDGIIVATLIASAGIRTPSLPCTLDLGALVHCLANVRSVAGIYGATVYMPHLGCGLSGGNWSIVEKLVEFQLSQHDIPVHVCVAPDQPLTYAEREAAYFSSWLDTRKN